MDAIHGADHPVQPSLHTGARAVSQNGTNPGFDRFVTTAVRIAGVVAAISGGSYLVAWLVGLAALWSAAGVLTMKTNMSLALVLAGATLVLLEPSKLSPWRKVLGVGGAVIVTVIGVLTLSEHAFRVDLGIDQLLASEAPGAVATLSPNRIGVPGSMSLALLGAGLLSTAWNRRIAVYLGLATCLVVIVPAIGFLYGISPFYRAPVTGIAWPTVVALFSLGLGLMLAYRRRGTVTVLWRHDPGGVLLRRALLPAVLIPLVLGYFCIQGERLEFYSHTTGTGLLVVAIVLLFCVVLWRSAEQLSATAAHREHLTIQLAAEKERLAVTVRSIGDAVIATDESRKVTVFNTVAEDLTGWTSEEAVGRPVEEVFRIINEETRKPASSPVDRVLSEGVIVGLANHTALLHKNGTERPIADSGAPIRDASGRVLGVVLVFRDQTEQRNAEQALRDASRLKDEFLSMASHELRTPLATLRLHAETLARSLRKIQAVDDRVERKLSVMDSQFDRMEALVLTLLDVSRITAGKLVLDLASCDLGALTREVVERFESQAESVGTDLHVRTCDVVGRWDRTRLDQVITNLLSNALKYGSGKPVEVALDERDGIARLVVQDYGIGISPESREKIFDRFERAANTRPIGGLGLGLWIAKRMVEAHGGTITVESAPGAGATFTVMLPRSVA